MSPEPMFGKGILLGAALAAGVMFTYGSAYIMGQYDMFNPNYWQSEVAEEIQKRMDHLATIEGLDDDGIYTIEEMDLIALSLMGATESFMYMDQDEGDLPAFDHLFSPGDILIDDMNGIYRQIRQADWYEDWAQVMLGFYERGEDLDLSKTDVDERLGGLVELAEGTLRNQGLYEQSLDQAWLRTESRKWMIAGAGGVFVALATGGALIDGYNKTLHEFETKTIPYS